MIIGQKSFGQDGPFVEDFFFDTSLNGDDFILATSETRYLTTINPGPAVTVMAVDVPKASKTQTYAQMFGAMLKAPKNHTAPAKFNWRNN